MRAKISIFFTLILICSFSSFAAYVPIGQARSIAKNAFYEKLSAYKDISYSEIVFSQEFTINYNNEVVYYAFNLDEENGYIVVAAEDRVHPILSYAFEGNYSLNGYAPAFYDWMEMYSKQIYHIISNNFPGTSEIDEQWIYYSNRNTNLSKSTSKDVGPLVTTKWDQDCYYNTACPAAAAGPCGYVLTGCVATSMAQFINYHEYPKKGSGSNSYNAGSYGTLSADFGSTTYNYKSMPDQLTAENAEVAKLMYHCGVAVEMNYGPYGSGAQSSIARDALVNYFNYSPSTFYGERSSYTDLQWKILIRADLINSRPLMYRGQGSGGHAFICDGFQYPDHFHFNWGWSGSGDGYFFISALNPSSGNFTQNQAAICNALPSTQAGSTGCISHDELSNSISIYPNPANHALHLEINNLQNDMELSIRDLSGRIVKEISIIKTQAIFSSEIQIENLNSGLYFLTIKSENDIVVKKFVKE
ncbi:MAG: thiol protease/hemagglutinin PrtT [Saprospiraceae bacterium]|nr:thiol protease/hemagglutinin PrtT [Saprospiraceae bacterium]